jgi:ACS family sodium-dependent inorganic phosphate cotransporter
MAVPDSSNSTAMPKRLILVLLCFAATFICYIDRVNISVAIIPMAEQYGWSATTKGFVLSSFFIGYLLAMLPGGWLAKRIGGKLLLGIALLGWSLFTFLTPIAAGLSFSALIATRILMGVGEAATFPAIYNLFARWLPVGERTRGVVFMFAGIPLGTIFALSTTGVLVAHYGWPSVFYMFGAAGLVFAAIWFRFIHATPAKHPTISAQERTRLADCVDDRAGQEAIPWRKLLSHSAVWALIINHFAANWLLYLALAWLPSYFRDVQHLNVTSAGLFAVGPWLAYFIIGNIAAWISDRAIARGTTITRIRKIMQITGLLGSGGFLLLASQAMTPAEALLTLCCAMGALGCTGAGFAGNHLDIGPKHADILYSLSNTAGTLPGIIGVAATGLLLDLTGTYTATFVLAAMVNATGALVWLIWSTGEPVFD